MTVYRHSAVNMTISSLRKKYTNEGFVTFVFNYLLNTFSADYLDQGNKPHGSFINNCFGPTFLLDSSLQCWYSDSRHSPRE